MKLLLSVLIFLWVPVVLFGQKEQARESFTRGMEAFKSQNYEVAIVHFTTSIQADRHNPEAYLHRAYSYHKLNKNNDAIVDYAFAIRLKPSVEAYNSRASLYSAMGQYQNAIDDYTKVIELNPKYDNAYTHRAMIYHKLQQINQALEDQRRAIAIDAHNKIALDYINRYNGFVFGHVYDPTYYYYDYNYNYFYDYYYDPVYIDYYDTYNYYEYYDVYYDVYDYDW